MAQQTRSQFADYFNRDPDAAAYDTDVAIEAHPVRTGYSAVIEWIAKRVPPESTVLDLGAGTGNTILGIPTSCFVTAVDISTEMIAIAKRKLEGRSVTFVQGDLLEFALTNPLSHYDRVISSYALHHLTQDERHRLFQKYKNSYPDLENDTSDEFFWDVSATRDVLASIGWHQTWERFSDLSWAVGGTRI